MKIVVDENISFGKEAFENFGEVELIHGRKIANKNLVNADALVVRSITHVNENLLANTKVKFIGTATIGTDHIDKNYLSRNNIRFAYAPGCNSFAVTEYVYSAITYLSNKYGFDIDKMSIGIIGYGNIGTKVASVADALGIKTVINDPPLQRDSNENKFLSLEETLKCDIVTFHVPLNLEGADKTVHLLNEDNISLIKENAILINASRGPVVDNNTLKNRLKKGKNVFAVLDVWEKEPDYDLELMELVEIGTPHIAGYSYEGKVNGTTMIYEQLCKFLNVKPNWKPKLPKVEDNLINLEEKKKNIEILTEIFKKSYRIKNDDILMREASNLPRDEKIPHFDSLRKNYSLRRELINYTAQINSHSQINKNLLSSFRLNIIEK
ncbi:Erythronate-4-phosphate dehydrogenase [hydrothermal vent metagenome]|uniref:Erythronate-4-phosphate dehydrogenase n=1 Tax=hydrothermal vent metagenome TaxID=652676 RepID=A0A3B1CB85_9ZZZZ